MHLSNKDIFKKSWLWSVICGIIVAILYWLIATITPLFNWIYDFIPFFDLLILFSLAGSYFGAGYVGWRIADKYYHDTEKRFVRRYVVYSILTFILLVAIAYSPLSILGLLWSLIAPFCVLQALKPFRPKKS